MNFWIEVTSGMRWDRMREERNVVLSAPNTTRYRNFFQNLKTDDLVLHYLTASLTRNKEKRSSAVGVSKVASDPTVAEKPIIAKCSDTLEFPKPVSYSALCGIKPKSAEFGKLLEVSMQRYLTQISQSDFELILGIYPANEKRFRKSPLAKQLH